jgi:CTP synthase (UTP-ammonia lyase)
MKSAIRIGLVGDESPAVRAHAAIPRALALAGAELGVSVEPTWLPTDAPAALHVFDGLWCVPGGPYASFDGVLAAIRWAREQERPFLGSCGGFQHALIEYARHVLGLADADHTESNPAATTPLVTPLVCSLVGVTAKIQLRAGSRVAAAYGQLDIVEGFHCRYGLNPQYAHTLASGPLVVSGVDGEGEVRSVELDGHPFFVATLFQSELVALEGKTPPLARALVRAAAG